MLCRGERQALNLDRRMGVQDKSGNRNLTTKSCAVHNCDFRPLNVGCQAVNRGLVQK